MSGFVAFDLETTGLSAKTDRIIEVGAVRFDETGRVLDTLELTVDPGMPIPLAIQRLVGLTDADVRGAPPPAEAVAQLAEFAEGSSLVAHGAAFDLAYCAAVVPQAFARREVFDTLELARILMPMAPSHSLPLLTKHLGITHDSPHRAWSDADATRALLMHLIGLGRELPADVLARIRALLATRAGSLQQFFSRLVSGAGEPRAAVLGGVMPPPRPLRVRTEGFDLPAAAAAMLGPDGPLAGDGYDYRDAQMQMTRAVAQTLQRGGRLMVEAGTGVGKSFAYLAPLLLHAVHSGERGVVATHTITLQEQLIGNDIPRMTDALGSPVAVAMLKGRHHYLSLRRWERFLAQPTDDVDALRFKLKVLVWLTLTRTGDRGELRLSSGEDGFWRAVESDTNDCLGSACANWKTARCFMVAARRAAAEADVVVTNHSLLLADAERQGTVLDRFSALVIDEAHRFEESATRQLGSTLRAVDVLEIIDRVGAGADDIGVVLDEDVETARDTVRRFFGDVKGFVAEALGHDNPANGTLAWDPSRYDTPMAHVVVRSATSAAAALRQAAVALAGPPSDERRPDTETALAAIALEAAAYTIERVLISPREGFVSWLELRAEQAELHEAPVSVADPVRATIFDKVDAAVLTSATLSVAGNFDFVGGRLGVGGSAETLELASPFDYLSQALTVMPTDIPAYDDDHYDEAMARLLGDIAIATDGRTLALFTGYNALRRVHGLLDRRLGSEGIAVLGQGLDGTRRQVLSSFLANPRAVLLGTASFWEGIDIPGDTLRCVVIAKLPFPVPSDPLVRARSDSLSDPFGGYILPQAVLRLKQGFGRLIRRSDDRGAVVLADTRLGSRDYAQRFLEALPPAAVARMPSADVAAAVRDFVVRGTLPELAATTATDTAEAPESLVGTGHDPHHEDPA